MPQWRVRDVMTTQVITGRDDASYAEIAARLTGERISAVPVVDRFDVGMVSGTDLQGNIGVGDLDTPERVGRWRWWAAPLPRWPASDLFKVHGPLDAVISDEVMERVRRRTLMIEPMTAPATVDEGVVILTGRIQRRTTAHAAGLLTEAVAGVTEVVDRLGFDLADLADLDGTVVAGAASERVDGEPRSVRRTAENRASNPSAQRAPMIAGLR